MLNFKVLRGEEVAMKIFTYLKITRYMFVFAGTIWFSFTMKLAIGPERFVTINGDTKTKNVPKIHHLSNYQSSVISI